MTSPHDSYPREPDRRRTVRLIFLAVAIYFAVGLAVRKKYGEFYPSLLMPSFAGIGLTTMTDKEGQTTLPDIVVTFSDHSTAALTLTQFSGPFFPSAVIVKYFVQDAEGKFRPPTPEAKAYAAKRLHQLFPGKTPIELRLAVNRITFALNRPNEHTVTGQVAEQNIIFP